MPICDYTEHSKNPATNYDSGMKVIPTIVSKCIFKGQ